MKVALRTLLLIGCFFFLLGQNSCPDFTKNGDDGGAVPSGAAESRRNMKVSQTGRIPLTVACTDQLRFTARAEEDVSTCSGYSFAGLYATADAAAKARAVANPLRCPPACPVKAEWRVLHHWDCGGSAPTAYATVSWVSQCVPLAGELGEPDPTAADLAAPNTPPATPGSAATVFVLQKELATGVVCNPAEAVRFEYEVDGITPKPATLQPFVAEAEYHARMYHGSLRCATNCRKQPYQTVRREWSWNNGVVRVVVYFVPCA